MFEVVEDHRSLTPQGAHHLGGGVPSFLDEVAGAGLASSRAFSRGLARVVNSCSATCFARAAATPASAAAAWPKRLKSSSVLIRRSVRLPLSRRAEASPAAAENAW